MKGLLLLVVILAGLWLWRARRPAPPPRRDPAPSAQEMVRCAHCGVHLPQADAVHGRLGHYCCQEHQRSAEH